MDEETSGDATTFAARMAAFNRSLRLTAALPDGIAAMNPFREAGSVALEFADAFYAKYYADNTPRIPILGINPGRHGAALSGVPFTDFKRLRDACGIDVKGHSAHEQSSEFIYEMIAAMGGLKPFYERFYINSVCPLGFTKRNEAGRWINYNYYDAPALQAAVTSFIVQTIRAQIALGLSTDECFILGKKNLESFAPINDRHRFFKKLTELPHPRFIIQYKRREMPAYIAGYCEKLNGALNSVS